MKRRDGPVQGVASAVALGSSDGREARGLRSAEPKQIAFVGWQRPGVESARRSTVLRPPVKNLSHLASLPARCRQEAGDDGWVHPRKPLVSSCPPPGRRRQRQRKRFSAESVFGGGGGGFCQLCMVHRFINVNVYRGFIKFRSLSKFNLAKFRKVSFN